MFSVSSRAIVLLLVLPFLVYAPTIVHEYGFRDDYSLMREAREESGKILVFTASHGRPVYGALLEASYIHVDRVSELSWMRAASVGLLALFALCFWRFLRRQGWPEMESVVVALVAVCLPASQVTASWAVGWPWGFSLILAIGGFEIAEMSRLRGGYLRVAGIVLAILLYILAAYIYQSNAMFVSVLLAAMLLAPSGKLLTSRQALGVSAYHLLILGVALVASMFLLEMLFATGVFTKSGRLEFETDISSKLQWFLQGPLVNAIAFPVIRDDFGTNKIAFWIVVIFVTALIMAAVLRRRNAPWLLSIAVLPWVAHGISLVAAERVLGYRTFFALSGLVLVLFVAAWRELPLVAWFGQKRGEGFHAAALSALMLSSLALAGYQSYEGIALPQGREWNLVKQAANTVTTKKNPAIYLIEPSLADRSTKVVYHDEFGSLSSCSSWVPDEMFRAAIKESFSGKVPTNWHYVLQHSGETPPRAFHYDLLVDMRALKQWQ